MCGIVGVVGKIFSSEERVFKDMLKFDTIRGEDSTGVLSVLHTKNTKIFKDIGTPYDLMKYKDFDDTVDRRSSALLLGHNRAATKGKVKPENAHPFDYDTFIGVHNGTLRGQWRLDDHKGFDVDSENIYYHMAANGITDTLKRLEGAFALAFYDKDNHQLVLVRNTERPLCYTYSKDKKTVFFASEPWMIRVACMRHSVEIEEVMIVEPKKAYKFNLPTTNGSQAQPYGEGSMFVEDVDFFIPPQSTYHGTYGYGNNTATHGHGSNVIPFDQKRIKDMNIAAQKWLDREVTFSVDLYVSGGRKEPTYFKCSEEYDDVEIRIFLQKEHPLYKKLLDSPHLFKAKIKGWGTHNGKGYFTVTHKTIQEVVENYNRVYYGYNNLQIPMYQWRTKTEKGCAVCEKIPTENDSATLEWIDEDWFLCLDCQNTHTGSMIAEARKDMVLYNQSKEK